MLVAIRGDLAIDGDLPGRDLAIRASLTVGAGLAIRAELPFCAGLAIGFALVSVAPLCCGCDPQNVLRRDRFRARRFNELARRFGCVLRFRQGGRRRHAGFGTRQRQRLGRRAGVAWRRRRSGAIGI
jgi:hypothetical protein